MAVEKGRKTALITGCSAGGIGSALAVEFQRRGIHVFATARNPAKMVHLESFAHVTLITLDITDSNQVQAATRQVHEATGGRLDYLVNNAAVGLNASVLDVNIDEAKRMFDTNLWGLIRMLQAFAPMVIATRGVIANISSLAANLNVPWIALYASSKAAMKIVSETLRLELEPFGVKVITVMTGTVDTNITNGEITMPQNSIYKSVEQTIIARAKGQDGHARMAPSKYAEKVVGDIMGHTSGITFRGQLASVGRIISTLPAFLLDRMVSNGTGLDLLRKSLASEKQK